MRKPVLHTYAKTKTQISFAVTAKLISAFVFAIRIVQSLYFLNPKFQASSHLLWLYSPVCVGPGRKPRRPVFSERGLYGLRRTQIPQSFFDLQVSKGSDHKQPRTSGGFNFPIISLCGFFRHSRAAYSHPLVGSEGFLLLRTYFLFVVWASYLLVPLARLEYGLPLIFCQCKVGMQIKA